MKKGGKLMDKNKFEIVRLRMERDGGGSKERCQYEMFDFHCETCYVWFNMQF